LPTDPAKKVCVVRVKESPEMCLVTKKGEQPVRVRVEDESRPADAAQLRAIMERKRSRRSFASELQVRVNLWASLIVTSACKPDANLRVSSGTRLWAVFFPLEHPEIELDVNTERKFCSIVRKYFPGFGSDDERVDLGPRSKDSYQTHSLILSHDFERVWQFDSSGAFGFASQTAWRDPAGGLYWSLCDLVIDLSLLLRASREFWESFGYFGGAQLVVRLSIDGLSLHYDPQGFHAIFHRPSGPIARDALAISPNPVTTRPLEGELHVTFQTDVVYVVSRIVNQLMRTHGHAADLPKLERSIGAILPTGA
jgi:hypothetical protein